MKYTLGFTIVFIVAITFLGCNPDKTKVKHHSNDHANGKPDFVYTDTAILSNSRNSTIVKRVGADSLVYELNISDSFPGYAYSIPHLTAIAGPTSGLHSFMSLENTTVLNNERFSAVFGVIDSIGEVGHLIKATPGYMYLQACDYYNNHTKYYFAPNGITIRNNHSNSITISAHNGLPGQVLQLNSNADTAFWAYPVVKDTLLQVSKTGEVAVIAGLYNIISVNTVIPLLTVKLPAVPLNGQVVELKLTAPVSKIVFAGGRVLSGYENYGMSSGYLKIVYNSSARLWY